MATHFASFEATRIQARGVSKCISTWKCTRFLADASCQLASKFNCPYTPSSAACKILFASKVILTSLFKLQVNWPLSQSKLAESRSPCIPKQITKHGQMPTKSRLYNVELGRRQTRNRPLRRTLMTPGNCRHAANTPKERLKNCEPVTANSKEINFWPCPLDK